MVVLWDFKLGADFQYTADDQYDCVMTEVTSVDSNLKVVPKLSPLEAKVVALTLRTIDRTYSSTIYLRRFPEFEFVLIHYDGQENPRNIIGKPIVAIILEKLRAVIPTGVRPGEMKFGKPR